MEGFDTMTEIGSGGVDGPVVLVTGARGFVGSALVGHLRRAGYQVVAASRDMSSNAAARLLPEPEHASDEEFDRLLVGIDHVVHLAAIAHTRLRGEESRHAYHVGNYLLTKRLAEAAARTTSGRFLFISSSRAQCGASFSGILTEACAPEPADDYGRAKLAGEKAVAEALPKARFSILRPVLVYGPGVKGNFATLQRLAALPIPLPLAALTARRSLLDRDALCRAIVHCLRAPATQGGTYLVADARPLAVCDIMTAVREGMGRAANLFAVPPWLLGIAAGFLRQRARWETLSRDLVADPALLIATGWKPQEDSAKAIRQGIAATRAETVDFAESP